MTKQTTAWKELLGLTVTCVLASGCFTPRAADEAEGQKPNTTRFLVRVVPATKRVERGERLADAATAIRLCSARNEFEPFQVAVRACNGPVNGVDAIVSDLVNRTAKHTIAKENIELFREHYLNVIQPSRALEWIPVGEYPGPMLPFRDPYDEAHAPYGAPFDNTRIGHVGKPYRQPLNHGPGFVFTAGSYKGKTDRHYVVQIDKPGHAGTATFRWSDSWLSGLDNEIKVKRWNREQVPIPEFAPDKRTVPILLNKGVAVQFAFGARSKDQNDFELGHSYHFDAYQSMNEVIWGDIYVPPNTPPGDYEGLLTVTAAEQTPVEIPIRLTVWDFAMPTKKSVDTAFAGTMGTGHFADAPNIAWLYEQMRHRHRMDPQRILGGALKSTPKGYDWTVFDKAAPPLLTGSAFPDGAPQNRFHLGIYGPGNDWQFNGMMGGDTNRLAAYAKDLAAPLKERGWMDRIYVYCHDEPVPKHYPGIIRDIKAFLAGDPAWRGTFMVTTKPKIDNPMLPWIDIWCPIYSYTIDEPTRAYLRKRGSKLWAYACCGPHAPVPTYHVDTLKGYECRIIKWASWKLGAEGFLYWDVSRNPTHPNPWTTVMTGWRANGDASFFFTGARNGKSVGDNATPMRPIMGPLADFRMKQAREGLEDWEYLILCERLKGRAFTEAIASEVYKQSPRECVYKSRTELDENYWTQDDNKIYDARARLARVILESSEQTSK